MKRLAIALLAVLITAAAPARAWCEASCLATRHTESAKPHCPTHEPSNDGTQISAVDDSECPTIEAARPVPVTAAVSQPALSAFAAQSLAPSQPRTFAHSLLRTVYGELRTDIRQA